MFTLATIAAEGLVLFHPTDFVAATALWLSKFRLVVSD
jgi:hypothetical protein